MTTHNTTHHIVPFQGDYPPCRIAAAAQDFCLRQGNRLIHIICLSHIDPFIILNLYIVYGINKNNPTPGDTLPLGRGEEIQQILGKLEDLGAAQLGLAIEPVHECDGHLANRVVQFARPHQHLHLEDVALGHASRD